MGTNLINPVAFADIEPLMNEAAREFLARMEEGEKCKFALPCPVADADNNPNTIHADVIRFCAWGGDEKHRVTGNLIHLEGVVVRGSLDLLYADMRFALSFIGCHFTEEVVVALAKCSGLHMDGSYFAKGIDAGGIQIKGELCLRDNFTAHGEVRLANAKISGSVDCRKSKFINPTKEDHSKFASPKKYALYASGIDVGGYFEARESAFSGAINMDNSHIGGTLNFMQATLQGGLIAAMMKTEGALVLQNIKGMGKIVLSFSKAGVLVDDESRKNFKFALNGFAYQELQNPGDVKERINWLNNSPKGDFTPQPFEQAATVLFAMGLDNDAREILLAKEQLHTKEGTFPPLHKWWRNILGWVAGYGYQLGKTLAWSLSVIAVCGALFFAADRMCHIVPSQPAVMAHINDQKLVAAKCPGITRPTEVAVCLFPEYPRFHPLSYSLDAFIPFFSLNQESYWHPQPAKAGNFVTRWFFAFVYGLEVFLGWVLTSLLVLFATGLLKPRQSSGGE